MKSLITGAVLCAVAFRWSRNLLCTGLICTSGLLAGCGTSGATKPTGSVTVSITSGGQPVPGGAVQLVGATTGKESGKGAFGDLDAAGSVKFPGVEVGTYTVTVMPPAPLDPDPSKPSPPPKNYSNIPPKFHSQTTSTLKAEVKPGDNKFAFDLKQ